MGKKKKGSSRHGLHMVTSQDPCFIVLYHHLVGTQCHKWSVHRKMVKLITVCDSSNVILILFLYCYSID